MNQKQTKTAIEREAIIAEYLLGGLSFRKLGLKHGVAFRALHLWVTKFRRGPLKKESPVNPIQSESGIDVHSSKVKKLQEELRKSKLHIELLNTMIDIAEDQLKIDIRKKVWHQAVDTVEQRNPRCINDLCLLLGYSRQSYYQGIKFIQQKAYEADVVIEEVLRYRKHQKRIGTRKLVSELSSFLAAHHFRIGRDAMFNLLADRGLLVTRRKRRGCITTLSKHRFKRYPNIIRDFIPIAPNQLWVSDITYIHLADGFAYLSLITDAYSRKIVGFYLSHDLSANGPLQALKMALKSNQNIVSLIHHSDRGVQYCCDAYVKLLMDNTIKISMTENGDPLENAIAERVNGILKQELLEEKFSNFLTAQNDVALACSTYNHLRPHGSIDNLKPAEAHQLTGIIKKGGRIITKSTS